MSVVEQYTTKVRQQQAAAAADRLRRWAELTRLWEQCCQAEGADRGATDSRFAPENPYLALYERSLNGYMG
jgi:hypothetical protein